MLTFIAKTFAGLEEVLADELREIGAQNVHILKRAVRFEGDMPLLFRANLQLRTALRILMPLAGGEVRSAKDLYNLARSVDWRPFFASRHSFVVDSSVQANEAFNHSGFVSLTVKDAVVDQYRDKYGERPSVDKNRPDVLISVHIYQEQCTISIDTSGESLHRRGYRQTDHEAPLNEVLAAALLRLIGWKAGSVLVEPMCGSGTIAIEAAMMAMNLPANYARPKFGFMVWKDFDWNLYQTVRNELLAKATRQVDEPFVFASDIDKFHVREAERNAQKAGVSSAIAFSVADFFSQPAIQATESKFVVFNPPYNERLPLEDIQAFYKAIGDTFKQQYAGYTAGVLTNDPLSIKAIRLSSSKKWSLFNGSIPCQFLKYELYEGTKRTPKPPTKLDSMYRD